MNRTVFALCVLFVARGWCDTLTINRMVVGHTHSIVDQLFHAVRGAVRRDTITTTVDALKLIHDAYLREHGFQLCWINKVIDFNTWSSPTTSIISMVIRSRYVIASCDLIRVVAVAVAVTVCRSCNTKRHQQMNIGSELKVR